MKLCPKCGKIADYSSYFGAYICNHCRWKDNTPNRERLANYNNINGTSNYIDNHDEQKKLAAV